MTARAKERKFLKVIRTVTVETVAANRPNRGVPSITPLSLSPTGGHPRVPAT
jgi:hypothetical protein